MSAILFAIFNVFCCVKVGLGEWLKRVGSVRRAGGEGRRRRVISARCVTWSLRCVCLLFLSFIIARNVCVSLRFISRCYVAAGSLL